MEWTHTEDILSEAVSLVGPLRPSNSYSSNRHLGNTNGAALGRRPVPVVPTESFAPSAATVVDLRDPLTAATDRLLEEWMGIPNPIRATAEEVRLMYERGASTAAAGRGGEAPSLAMANAAVTSPHSPSSPMRRTELEYANGQFYRRDVPPTEAELLLRGAVPFSPALAAGVAPTVSPLPPPPLTEEELREQGDAICDAVHWLLVSQEQDRALEEVEAILVRARMSEVAQCNGAITLIEDEIRARSSTIMLIQTQIAQLNELGNLAMARLRSTPHAGAGGGYGGALQEADEQLYLEDGSDGAESASFNRTAGGGGGRSSFGNHVPPAGNGGGSAGRNEATDSSSLSPLPNYPSSNANKGRVPLGPVPSMSPTRQKMLSFALGGGGGGPSGRGQQRRSGNQPQQPSALAAADEILRSVAASAGGVTSHRGDFSSSLINPTTGAYHRDPFPPMSSGAVPIPMDRNPAAHAQHERHLASMDAKLQARLDKIRQTQIY